MVRNSSGAQATNINPPRLQDLASSYTAPWARKGSYVTATKLQSSGVPHASNILDIKHRRPSIDRADSDRLLDSMAHMECRDITPSMLAPLKTCMLTGILV
jgi:hypothetical protein